ncbi:MAG: hypothetical protein K2O30_07530, partial [Duncaniella sp.]|nr:hypothetical protein [Duncaniella sp.]
MNNNPTDINDRNIAKWVERFLDGETTCAEEAELYRYFSRPVLPAEMEQYKDMFAWYSTLSSGKDTANSPTDAQKSDNRVRILRLLPWQWISVAASIAILLAIGFIFRPAGNSALSEEYMAYEGSYIIRDGKKITDLSIVVPEILRQEQMLNERIQAIEMSFEDADDIMRRSVESSVDMSNPDVYEA